MQLSLATGLADAGTQNVREPVCKIFFSEEGELITVDDFNWTEYAPDGGSGATTGFLAAPRDESSIEYTTSALGIFDYYTLPNGEIVVAAAVPTNNSTYAFIIRLKRFDPKVESNWTWTSSQGYYIPKIYPDDTLPKWIKIWYCGGVNNNGMLMWGGNSKDAIGRSSNNTVYCGLPTGITTGTTFEALFGGTFTTFGAKTAWGIAKFNGSTSSPIFSGDEAPATNQILAMCKDASGNYYFGGQFTVTDSAGVTATNIIKYNLASGTFTSLGQFNDVVQALCIFTNSSVSKLYAGGRFYSVVNRTGTTTTGAQLMVCDLTVADTARVWAKTTNPLGTSVPYGSPAYSEVCALATDSTGVFIAGNFPAPITNANNVVKFTPTGAIGVGTMTKLSTTGGATNGVIRTLLWCNPYLYAGGTFTLICGDARTNLARIYVPGSYIWQRCSSAVADVTNGPVYGLSLSAGGTYVYISGDFTAVEGTTTKACCRFTISSMTHTAMTGITNGIGRAFVPHPTDATKGYLCGSNLSDTDPTNPLGTIGYWNGSAWSSLPGAGNNVQGYQLQNYILWLDYVDNVFLDREWTMLKGLPPKSSSCGRLPPYNNSLEYFYGHTSTLGGGMYVSPISIAIADPTLPIITEISTGAVGIPVHNNPVGRNVYAYYLPGNSNPSQFVLVTAGTKTEGNAFIGPYYACFCKSIDMTAHTPGDITETTWSVDTLYAGFGSEIITLMGQLTGTSYQDVDSAGDENNTKYQYMSYSRDGGINFSDPLLWQTKNNGLAASSNVPGNMAIIDYNSDILYSVGGPSHAVTPYSTPVEGPWYIQKLSLLGPKWDGTIRTEMDATTIISCSVTHSGLNTPAQCTLQVANKAGRYNTATWLKLGSKFSVMQGYKYNGQTQYAVVGMFAVDNINYTVEADQQIITIDATDYLRYLRQKQSEILDVKESQLITAPDWDTDVVTNKEVVVMEGETFWDTTDVIVSTKTYAGGRIIFENTENSGVASTGADAGNYSYWPHTAITTSGETMTDFVVECSFTYTNQATDNGSVTDFVSDSYKGNISIILCGNPTDIRNDSLCLSIHGFWKASLCRLITKQQASEANRISERWKPPQYVDRTNISEYDHVFTRDTWYDLRVMKRGKTISLWWKSTGSATWNFGHTWSEIEFNIWEDANTWYKEGSRRGKVGVVQSVKRTTETHRRTDYSMFKAYSVNRNKTVSEIIKELGTDQNIHDFNFENQFEDTFWSPTGYTVIDPNKWQTTNYYHLLTPTIDAGLIQKMRLKADATVPAGDYSLGLVLTKLKGHDHVLYFQASTELTGLVVCGARITTDFKRGWVFTFSPTNAGGTSASQLNVYQLTDAGFIRVQTLDTIYKMVAGNNSQFCLSTQGSAISLWYSDELLCTIVDSNDYDPDAATQIDEYFGIGANTAAFTTYDEVICPKLDTVVTGMDGHVGVVVNPGDNYLETMQTVAELGSGSFFVDGSTLLCGSFISEETAVDVFNPTIPPWEFKGNLFRTEYSKNDDEWYDAVKVIDATGTSSVIIRSQNPSHSNRTFIYFAEGITERSKMKEIGKAQLREKSMNKEQQTFQGFCQVGLMMRDRVNITVYNTPSDPSSGENEDITGTYVVDSYSTSFDNGESPNLSMSVTVVKPEEVV
jgi:hypothetical protein